MKEKLTEEEFINKWLEYHNITLEEILDNNPEWKKDPQSHTRDFYEQYAVTQEQHDEWYDWAIERLSKYYRFSKKYCKRMFALSYLNVSPNIL